MSPIDKTLAGIQSECVALRRSTSTVDRHEYVLDTLLDMIDVLAAELRVQRSVLEGRHILPENQNETD